MDWLSGFVNAIVALLIAAQSTMAVDASLRSANAPTRVEALRQGGFVIFFRHARADRGSDATPFDLADCSRQRNLGEAGREEARRIGQAFRDLKIPVGDVLSSEYCRALETARLAFGRAQPASGLNNCCDDGRPLTEEERRAYLLHALATRPRAGTNTVLIGHAYFMVTDLAMGEAAVYAPDGVGGFVRVARILPSEWQNGVYRPGARVIGAPELSPGP